jgi:phosphoribosylamine--glycine ligase
MNILLLGSGGREHAFAYKIAESPHCKKLYIAPGNPGTEKHGSNVDLSVMDFEAIERFVLEHDVEMIVVGPEEPLVKGIHDYFRRSVSSPEMAIIGPSAAGARLEGSKEFAKEFMKQHGIPTAGYASFTKNSMEEGKAFLENHATPIVLKADGLAAGKGVVICDSREEAEKEFEEMLDGKFGSAGVKVVVEEYLNGVEMSVCRANRWTSLQDPSHRERLQTHR